MYRHIGTYPEDVLSPQRNTAAPSSGRRGQGAVADEPPLFALLRSTLGLPPDDPRWSIPQPVLADPTVDLLERTLAGLHAWEPYADVRGPRAGRHAQRAGQQPQV